MEENTATRRKKIGHSAIATLGDLYQILRKAWCKETAYPFGQAEWGAIQILLIGSALLRLCWFTICSGIDPPHSCG